MLNYLKTLRNSGLRATELRVAMLIYLHEHHGPFTVREIYENLGRQGNLATIYRNAEVFVEKGLAVTCDFDDGLVRYELRCDGHSHHHHMVCKKCRKWTKVDICLSESSFDQLKETGYQEITHKLEFFGICPECAADHPAL